jgi:parallel beta-helix repeat protein
VIVGYDDAGQYWLCKNSWGTGWADAGYFRIHFDTGLHFTGIDSYSNYSVSEDQSCYAKIVPNLITSLSTALSYSFWSEGNEVVYVLGNTTTSNDATVPANATLQLSPGVTVQAASGKMIIIDGQINAQGTVSQTITFDRNGSSGSWYGLVLQSGSTGIVNLCHFNNATVGVTCNSSSPTISNSVFRNDYFGIYCNPCTPTISGNDIQYCSNSGIYLTGASPAISSNTLSNNSSYGIFCHNTSDPSLSGNTMAGNGTAGLYCEYYSSPYLALPAFSGNNVIANNSVYGIETYSYSNPVLGTGQARGYNSMFSNSSYDVAEFSNCTVSAQYNWWGVYPANPSRFYLSGSTLDYSNALSYNPNPGRPKVGVQGVSPVLAGPTSDSTFNLAFNYALIQAYDDAIRLYLEVFGKAPMGSFLSREALVFLAEAYERSGRTDFLGCLENQIAPRAVGNIEMSIIVQELEGHWLVKAGQYSDAVAIYRELHEKFASSPEVDKFAIFNIGEISYLYLNDHASAVESFGLFKNMYPNDPLAPVAALLMSADLSATPQKGAAPSSSPRPLPTSFSLESNYPNPFNPSTQITYSLSKTGKVSLMIFDILGREIATLADGYQQPGQYTVTWNALKSGGNVVSSGVYLARLEVFSELGAIDFTKTIRLLLLK